MGEFEDEIVIVVGAEVAEEVERAEVTLLADEGTTPALPRGRVTSKYSSYIISTPHAIDDSLDSALAKAI